MTFQRDEASILDWIVTGLFFFLVTFIIIWQFNLRSDAEKRAKILETENAVLRAEIEGIEKGVKLNDK